MSALKIGHLAARKLQQHCHKCLAILFPALDCTISINNINRMNLDLMSVLVPTFKLGINDAVLLAEGDYRNITCLGLLVVKFQYPFEIFTACHNRIFMFCSAKVTWSCKMPWKQLSAVLMACHQAHMTEPSCPRYEKLVIVLMLLKNVLMIYTTHHHVIYPRS